jgi:hypothetical protein
MLTASRSGFVLCAATALALPAGASGGVYGVTQCNQALAPSSGQALSEQNAAGYTFTADCDTGAGLQVERPLLGSNPPATYGRWVWRAPAGTVFAGIQANATLVDGSSQQARLIAVGPGGQLTAFGLPGAAFSAYGTTGEFSELRAELACPGPASCPAGGSPRVAVRDLLLRVDDRAAPSVALADGSLFAGDAVRGPRTAVASASDEGGGVRRLELRVNDEIVSDDIRDCEVSGGLATALRPCAAQTTSTATLNTSEAPFATGVNEVTLCGSDLALEGQPNRGCVAEDVFVDNICPESSLGAGSKLRARFAGAEKRVRLRSTDRPVVVGTLTSDSGDGIGGSKVCALTRVALPGQPYEVADVAKTRADGSYRLRLPAGASRKVFVDRVFEGEVLMRDGLRTEASVRPSFRIKPGGEAEIETGGRLRFRGKLPGPGCEARVVKVQAKIGKRRWQVFRGIRSDDDCVFKTRFKLRATSERTRYLFRVRVPEQADYPYLAGSSTVRARVAGPGGD